MTEISQLAVLPPCREEIRILVEDGNFLLINKPAGLLSVPGRHPDNRDSVISRLEQRYPGAAIVHRLDFDTSGVMVVPLNRGALSAISKQFQARSVHKTYTAVVAGRFAAEEGCINLPIGPDAANRPKYKIDPVEGKPSLTEYRVIAWNAADNTSRVFLHPVTGRSHQLRLHMSASGHPILGCIFYGQDVAQAAPRLLLHATELRFVHPSTSMPVAINCNPDF